MSFDYKAPAGLFLSKVAKGSRIKYRRFATAAEASPLAQLAHFLATWVDGDAGAFSLVRPGLDDMVLTRHIRLSKAMSSMTVHSVAIWL